MRLVFLTGTRADYGKLKPLMLAAEEDTQIESYIYATGMHLQKEYGHTLDDILADGYANIYTPKDYTPHEKMELDLADTIVEFSRFIGKIHPDFIVVHGDRVEPLAGAITGVMNNIRVAHIEGGEVTGTADEFMRHAITKLSSLHFVANEEARLRLLQLGEKAEHIHVIGSPDIDVMLSENLPDLSGVREKYGIVFDRYAILIYHPVTTSPNLNREAAAVADAVLASGRDYVVIFPNNDSGSGVIRREWRRLAHSSHFVLFSSLPFEDFLTLLHNADFIIGNSSAGIREACVYGIPAIDIGTRQTGRFHASVLKNIQHCGEDVSEILGCIGRVGRFCRVSRYFGDGKSAERFIRAIKEGGSVPLQKGFVETPETAGAIMNYINEVCF